MNPAPLTLLELLTLEQIDTSRFRGWSLDIGARSVFGGQILGQALAAANRTVEERLAHSLHAYFLHTGEMSVPIDFVVERIRDGRSFSTRKVTAMQQGRTIFLMIASFQAIEKGLVHQKEMSAVPQPEDLPTMAQLANDTMPKNPDEFWIRKSVKLPIEFRVVEPENHYHLARRPPFQKIWFRSATDLPDDPFLQQCALAYASDFGLLKAASLPHAISFREKHIFVASIDHALWFHRSFRFDQWLLYEMESPNASNSRGFAKGNIFDRDGVLVASTAQEGLIRVQ